MDEDRSRKQRKYDNSWRGLSLSKFKDRDLETWYISGSYRFNEWFEYGMYYSKDDGLTNGSGELNRLNDICATLRFDVNSYWTLKLEGHMMDGLRNA